jgi:hypothetical protein
VAITDGTLNVINDDEPEIVKVFLSSSSCPNQAEELLILSGVFCVRRLKSAIPKYGDVTAKNRLKRRQALTHAVFRHAKFMCTLFLEHFF